jgi:hypothetical protein
MNLRRFRDRRWEAAESFDPPHPDPLPSGRGGGIAIGLIFALFSSIAQAQCTGDCDASGRVTIDELVLGTRIALGLEDAQACEALFSGCGASGVCIDDLVRAVSNSIGSCGLPELLSSDPAADAVDVPRSAWVILRFAAPVDPGTLDSLALDCSGQVVVETSLIDLSTVVLNPVPDLPAPAICRLTWSGMSDEIAFSTGAPSEPVEVSYDRTDRRRSNPFPDDFWLEEQSGERRLNVPVPDGPADLQSIFAALLEDTNRLDGFSQIAHFVVELFDAPDPASLPRTPAESLDPLATVGLFALDVDDLEPGQRVPFRLEVRRDTSVRGVVGHSLLLFPSIPLRPGGRYGLVVTRRALADATRTLGPSAFFAAALGEPIEGEAAEVTRVRALAADVLDVLGEHARPPARADDVALAVRITVRGIDDLPLDLLAIKQQVLEAPPPSFEVLSVEEDSNEHVAAIVSGTWQAPDFRDGLYLKRDEEGRPVQARTRPIPFTLALPAAALDGPIPLTMYQHGNPGSSEREVPNQVRRYLGEVGFAVAGFTDILNREVAPGITDQAQAITAQAVAVISALLTNHKDPDFWVETHAEQIAFLRMLQGMGSLDVLPINAPDGVPELDLTAALTYVGVSEGANNGQAFLPFAPEIRAAALVVGGARLGEVLIHQGASLFINQLGSVFPSLTPAEIWTGISLFQTIHDAQDPHNKAQFLYRQPIEVAGTTRKPSILVIEGIDDSLVPNHATDSLAWSMGPIPHLEPVQRPVPFLRTVTSPVTANFEGGATAAFFQYVPVGVEGIEPTPGCTVLPESSAREGHYCAQSAAESHLQRVIFFQTALEDAPVIIDPFAVP